MTADIPTPQSTGSSGTQSVGTEVVVTTQVMPPMHCSPIPDTLDGLAATHSRNLGGDVSARLIAGSMRHFSEQLSLAQNALLQREQQLHATTEILAVERIKSASLSERLGAAGRFRLVAQVCTFTGTILLGVAVDLFKSQVLMPAYLLTALGVALLAVSLVPLHKGIAK